MPVRPVALDPGEPQSNAANVLDFAPPQVPYRENVIVATAGWAIKFAPMFGSIMAELAIKGASARDIEPMSITRPGVLVDLYPGEAATARTGTPEHVS